MRLDDLARHAAQDLVKAAATANRPGIQELERVRRGRAFILGVSSLMALVGMTIVAVSVWPESPPVASESTTRTPQVMPIAIGPLEPRGGHSVIWTGEEVIVWGGEGNETGSVQFGNGAAYNPASDSWRAIEDAPITPRRYHVAAWTGVEMLVVGGVDERDGAKYFPATDSWELVSESPIPIGPPAGLPIEGAIGSAWTGDQLVVWHVATDQLAAYDPESDQWTLLPPTGLKVDNGALRWNGVDVYAFGDHMSSYPQDRELLVLRLRDGQWQQLPSAEFSTTEDIVAAGATLTQWAGDRFISWSMSGQDGLTRGLVPDDDAWAELARNPHPPCDGQGEPIQADDAIISFGWCGSNAAIYEPSNGSWTTFEVTGSPTARYTVWTGVEIINWGDTCCYGTGGQAFTVDAWRKEPPG